MRIFKICLFLFLLIGFFCSSYVHSEDTLKIRKKVVYTGIPAIAAATSAGLYVLWYKDYSSGNFKFFNDNHEWMGMDKIGHGVANFHTMSSLVKFYDFAGTKHNKSLLYSGLITTGFFTGIELMDGLSEGWGFSYGDIIANLSGIGLFGFQHYFFGQSYFIPKFSFYPSPYRKLRPNLLGQDAFQSIIKDYNAQTYWLSYNLGNHFKVLPKWFCISFGYSVDGLLGADDNIFISKNIYYDFSHIPREKQFLFSLDIDLSKINVKNEWLNLLLHNFEFVKIPFPALAYQNKRGLYLGF